LPTKTPKGWTDDRERHRMARAGIMSSKSYNFAPFTSSYPGVFASSDVDEDKIFEQYAKTITAAIKAEKGLGKDEQVVYEIDEEIPENVRKRLMKAEGRVTILDDGKTIILDLTAQGAKAPTEDETRGEEPKESPKPKPESPQYLPEKLFDELMQTDWNDGEIVGLPMPMTRQQKNDLLEKYPKALIKDNQVTIFTSGMVKQVPKTPKKGLPKPEPKRKPKGPLPSTVTTSYKGKQVKFDPKEASDTRFTKINAKIAEDYGMMRPVKRAKDVTVYLPERNTYGEKNSYWFDLLDSWMLMMAGWEVVESTAWKARMTVASPEQTPILTKGTFTAVYIRPIDVKLQFYAHDSKGDTYDMPPGKYKFRKAGELAMIIPADKDWTDTKAIRFVDRTLAKGMVRASLV